MKSTLILLFILLSIPGFTEAQTIRPSERMHITPSIPAYVRQGDVLEFTVELVNPGKSEITGQVQLELFDTRTKQAVDGYFLNTFPNQYFTVGAGSREMVKFPLHVPYSFYDGLVWKVTARSGEQVDVKGGLLPVVNNKELKRRSMPLPVQQKGVHPLSFEPYGSFRKANDGENSQSSVISFQYFADPHAAAALSLPYLMELPGPAVINMLSRAFAYSLAIKIREGSPGMIEAISKLDSTEKARLHPLQQAELLELTPHLRERGLNPPIGASFHPAKLEMAKDYYKSILKINQDTKGGFPWMNAASVNGEDRLTTQNIVILLGRMQKLNLDITALQPVLNKAIARMDSYILADIKKGTRVIEPLTLHALFARTYFPSIAMDAAITRAYKTYMDLAKQINLKDAPALTAMQLLVLHRNKISKAQTIRGGAVSQSFVGDGLLLAPEEINALHLELLAETGGEANMVNAFTGTLLQQRKGLHWSTPLATVAAAYSLMLQKTEPVSATLPAVVQLGGSGFEFRVDTSFYQQRYEDARLSDELTKFTLAMPQSSKGHGFVYWQYFDTIAKTHPRLPVKTSKKIFVLKKIPKGNSLVTIQPNTTLSVGDTILVRISLQTATPLYHLEVSDQEASGLTPVKEMITLVNAAQHSYYRQVDARGARFYLPELPKGNTVLEYRLVARHEGSYESGNTLVLYPEAPDRHFQLTGMKLTIER